MSDNTMQTITGRELQALKMGAQRSFNLPLADGQEIWVEEMIRLMPKKRLVAFGRWAGEEVVIKLFFAKKTAKRDVDKDAAGVKILLENKVPTPAFYYQGMSADKRVHVLIFKRITESKNLGVMWQARKSIPQIFPLLKAVVVELATQHVLGVLQQDLHLNNFLITRKRIYTLDGGQIIKHPQLLNKKLSMENLALFLAQLGVGVDELQEKLFKHYAAARGWLLKPEDMQAIFFLIKKWNRERWESFSKKIYRNSSDFAAFSGWRMSGMLDRHYQRPELMAFLQDPDAIFTQAKSKILKAGRSATVIRVTLDRHDLVIKRYNMKSAWHHMRRCLRTTRAETCWYLAQKMQLFGVKTAKPVAFLEKHISALRGKSYFVMEYVGDQQVSELLKQPAADDMIEKITTLLKGMLQLEITQGDLKITNLLLDDQQEPVLIDLDGAKEHMSLTSLRSAWRKEVKRFLKNFEDQPTLLEKFKRVLVNLPF